MPAHRDHATAARCSASAMRGFTLIEVMIVVVIVSVLATVAFPSYQSYVTRSRRTDAKAMLQQASMWMERNQASTYRYDSDIAGTAVNTAKLSALGFAQTPTTGSAVYVLSFPVGLPTAAGYVLIADPQGAQAAADTACGVLAVDNVGQRGRFDGVSAVIVDAAAESCWQR